MNGAYLGHFACGSAKACKLLCEGFYFIYAACGAAEIIGGSVSAHKIIYAVELVFRVIAEVFTEALRLGVPERNGACGPVYGRRSLLPVGIVKADAAFFAEHVRGLHMHSAVRAVYEGAVGIVYRFNAGEFALGGFGVILGVFSIGFCGSLLGLRGDGGAAFHAELVSSYKLFTAIFAKHYIHILSDGFDFYITI